MRLTPRYSRILLKLSGESFKGNKKLRNRKRDRRVHR